MLMLTLMLALMLMLMLVLMLALLLMLALVLTLMLVWAGAGDWRLECVRPPDNLYQLPDTSDGGRRPAASWRSSHTLMSLWGGNIERERSCSGVTTLPLHKTQNILICQIFLCQETGRVATFATHTEIPSYFSG